MSPSRQSAPRQIPPDDPRHGLPRTARRPGAPAAGRRAQCARPRGAARGAGVFREHARGAGPGARGHRGVSPEVGPGAGQRLPRSSTPCPLPLLLSPARAWRAMTHGARLRGRSGLIHHGQRIHNQQQAQLVQKLCICIMRTDSGGTGRPCGLAVVAFQGPIPGTGLVREPLWCPFRGSTGTRATRSKLASSCSREGSLCRCPSLSYSARLGLLRVPLGAALRLPFGGAPAVPPGFG